MSMKVLEVFKKEDLAIVDFFGPKNWEPINKETGEQLESWANILVNETVERGDCYAYDFEGTTTGDGSGINILIPKIDLPKWEEQAAKLGVTVCPTDLPIKTGRYGAPDTTCILTEDDGNNLYWIEYP